MGKTKPMGTPTNWLTSVTCKREPTEMNVKKFCRDEQSREGKDEEKRAWMVLVMNMHCKHA